MATEYLPIKERIELRAVAIAEAGLATWLAEEVAAGRLAAGSPDNAVRVERWDQRGNSRHRFSTVIQAGSETAKEGGTSPSQITQNQMALLIDQVLTLPGNSLENSSTVFNRWLARWKKAFTADINLVEPDTHEALAVDVRVTGSASPPTDDNQPEFYLLLELEITYEEYRDNPYAGPGITQKAEA